ncbi:MAG: hypothetical protein GY841_21085 [FCB group bacterium]|nr:hypothetical protein [FCB group bacterium]
MRASPSAEAALVALYPLLVRTLLLLPEKNPLNEEGGTLHALVDVWQEHAVDVVTSATYLLARFDPKTSPIISRPHVWAALLDAMSIVAEEEDEVGMVTRTLLSEVKHDAEIGVAMIADSPLPVVRSGSLWEPWGTLSVLVQLGAKHTGLATHVAEGIVQALETKSIIKPRLPIIGGCTHIWSILVRRSVPMAAVQKEAKKKELVQRVAPLVTAQEFVPAAKFDYIHWPRGEKERIARDVRAFEVHQAWIRGGERGNPSIPSRFAALYRGDPASELGLTRNSNSRCQSLLLSGYSTSGKSKAAEFLEHHAGLGRMVMRVVAGATWELGESWEKPYYNEVTEAFFNEQKNELFGVHQLRGARFGFSTQDYNDIPESLIRILPVGWSQKAIVDVDKFCQSRGDESVLVAFRPSESILEQRIRKRWVGEDVPRHLNKAKEFYRCLPEKAIVIDSSGPEEEMFCELFRQLQGVLTYGEGYDVAVSYAGTRDQIAVAEEIKSALRTVGITAFVACQDTAPNRKPTAQGNIDLVFELADVIVVIWSEDYPMREFSRYEWTQWVIDKWKKNDNGVVFVDFDGSRMPPGFHEAASIKWEPSQATAVACAVKNRLRLINRS